MSASSCLQKVDLQAMTLEIWRRRFLSRVLTGWLASSRLLIVKCGKRDRNGRGIVKQKGTKRPGKFSAYSLLQKMGNRVLESAKSVSGPRPLERRAAGV